MEQQTVAIISTCRRRRTSELILCRVFCFAAAIDDCITEIDDCITEITEHLSISFQHMYFHYLALTDINTSRNMLF